MMEVSKVSNDDGRKCAQLLNLLKLGRWDLSGGDIKAYAETVQWVQELAGKMASQLKDPEPSKSAPPTEGFRVKSMGHVPALSKKAKKK